jgi:hypothetical protein
VSTRPRNDRFWFGFLAGALLVLMFCTPESDARHVNSRACPQHVAEGVRARERFIRCEDRRIGAPRTAGQILAIARCESGADLLDPAGDAHAGPFQQAVAYWPGRFRTWTGGNHPGDGHLRNHPAAFRSNVIVSLRMARARGWEGDWSCA